MVTVYHLFGADAAVIVAVARRGPRLRELRHLPAVLPGEGHAVPVGKGISDRVVGNILPVVTGQLVLPVGVSITIDYLMVHIIVAYRQVIDGNLENVPAVVIGIAVGKQTNPVFVPGQLAQGVIGILAQKRSVFVNLGDIAQLVVSIGQRIGSILHRLDEGGGGVGQGPVQILIASNKGRGGVQSAGGKSRQVVIAVA